MRLHNILILTICALTAVACGKDSDEQTPSEMAGSTLSFAATTGESGTELISQGDVVGITMWDDATGQTHSLNQKLVAAENGELISEEDIKYPATATSLSVFAYMPFRTDWSTNVNYRRVEVYSDQSIYENYHASDFLVGRPVNGNPITSTKVKLGFDHVMSRINIELTDPSEGVGLSTAAVKITDIYTAAFVNPYTGEVTTIEGQKGSVIAYKTLGAKTRSDRRETMSAIIPAQTIEAGSAFIEININSKKYKFSLPEILNVGYGTDYNYSLELTGETLRLISSTVTNWKSGGETDVYIDKN